MKKPEPNQPKKARPELPRHDKFKYLRFTIMHEEASNISSSYSYPHRKTTWNARRIPFSWSITRPETGKETFSTNCPVCKQPLGIEVDSLASLSLTAGRTRKMGVVSKILAPVLLIALIASILIDRQAGFGILQFVLVIGLFGCAIGAAGSTGIPLPGYIETGVFMMSRSRGEGPFNGHYVEKVESSNDKI